MTLTVEVVDRAMIETLFSLERSFMELHAEQVGDIPAMPRMKIGRHFKYHIPSVRAWLLKNFQVGGE